MPDILNWRHALRLPLEEEQSNVPDRDDFPRKKKNTPTSPPPGSGAMNPKKKPNRSHGDIAAFF